MKEKIYTLENSFKLLGKDWALITAKVGNKINTMTASWGGFGHLWNKNIVYIYIRPQRYTYEFVDNSDYFTLSFFDEEHRQKLLYLGKHSGRDGDKIKASGLTPLYEKDHAYFSEAKLVLVCKKIYKQKLDPKGFIDEKIEEFYKNDYHTMYIGEIVEIIDRR